MQFSKCNEGTELREKTDGENNTIEGMLHSSLQMSVFKINLNREFMREANIVQGKSCFINLRTLCQLPADMAQDGQAAM